MIASRVKWLSPSIPSQPPSNGKASSTETGKLKTTFSRLLCSLDCGLKGSGIYQSDVLPMFKSQGKDRFEFCCCFLTNKIWVEWCFSWGKTNCSCGKRSLALRLPEVWGVWAASQDDGRHARHCSRAGCDRSQFLSVSPLHSGDLVLAPPATARTFPLVRRIPDPRRWSFSVAQVWREALGVAFLKAQDLGTQII